MTTLYVGKFNLSTIGEEQLRRAFQPFGSLSWVRVKEGYAFVNFVEECAAQKAYQAHGQGFVLCGERMVVRWARLQQQRGGVHGANGSDERRFGAHSLRGGRPSFRREGRFCTICRRAGHDTEVCYYNSAARRGGLGGAEGGAKGAPGGQRGDANGRDHRGVDGTARLRKGTDELRDEVARAEPRLNRRDRDAVEGRVHECGGNSQKVQIPEGNGARGGKARPAETKGADRVNGKALVCAAEAGSLGGKRKGQSVSRERSRR